MAKKLSRYRRQIFSGILIIGLSALVVILATENQRLKNRLDSLGKRPETLKVNEKVSLLMIRSIKGKNVEIDLSAREKKTLMLLFSTTCPHCEKNLNSWREIVEVAKSRNYNIIGISTHDSARTVRFVQNNHILFPVFLPRDSIFFVDFKVAYVPQTIEFGKDGVVEDFWGGELDSVKLREILKKL